MDFLILSSAELAKTYLDLTKKNVVKTKKKIY